MIVAKYLNAKASRAAGKAKQDVPATDVLPVCYQVKAGALCLPFANPRHSHEVDAFRTRKLPDRMTLVCGVVETTHNYVEHPLVIAEHSFLEPYRAHRYLEILNGKEPR